MKKLSVLLALLTMLCYSTHAQITVSSSAFSSYYYGSATVPGSVPACISFSVINTNTSSISLSSVGYCNYNGTGSIKLYYRPGALTGSAGNLTAAPWVLISTVTNNFPLYTFTINNNFFNNLNLTIPGSSTYSFAVAADDYAFFGGPSVTTGNTGGGVTLDNTAAGSYWGLNTAVNITAYAFHGSITFNPCPAVVAGATASNIKSKSADLSWTATAGSAGYDYIVNTTPTYTTGTLTSTTATGFSASGLTPATNYYLHVRSKCSATASGIFTDYPFTTKPPCEIKNFKVTLLMPDEVKFQWDGTTSCLDYDYLVDQDRDDPTSTTGLVNTAVSNGGSNSLVENTTYYVHIRANCDGEQSPWLLDSFTTPIPCRAPDVKIDHLSSSSAIAYWKDVPTALHYEYVISTNPVAPEIGTKYTSNSINLSSLNDGKDYYIHARSYCNSQGQFAYSPWNSIPFKTYPTGIANVTGNDFGVQLYPNPADKTVTITIHGSVGEARVLLTDVNGKILSATDATGKSSIILDVEKLPGGMYFIKYADGVYSKTIKLNKK